jgi:putative transposase
MLKVVHDVEASNEPAGGSLLDEIVRDGARQMLAAALQAEVAAYVEQFKDELDEHGRRLVVRNGFHAEREVTTAAGAIPVRAPRVNDKRVDEATGERKRFGSAILPAWARKSPRVAEVLPLLYLHGLSSSDFAPALTQFLGTSHGLSAATITRLTKDWQDEATAFNKRSLADTDYVYLWVDGIHLQVRLEQDKVCLLVMIGVRADGTKELVALTDGHRESSESWADLLRDCKRRGMAAPVLAIGDGALGFWAALRDVFPATREQRCWFHKIANVLNALPKSAQPGAKAALAEIWNAEDREHAEAAARSFVAEYGTKWPKGGREDHRRPRRAAGVLQLPRRAPGPPAYHEPARVDLRHRSPSAAGHQGARIAGGRRGDGVQAHRVRPATVACRQRTPPRRSRPGRSPVREGPPGRTSRRIRRRSASRMTRQSAGLDYCSCAREGAPDEC